MISQSWFLSITLSKWIFHGYIQIYIQTYVFIHMYIPVFFFTTHRIPRPLSAKPTQNAVKNWHLKRSDRANSQTSKQQTIHALEHIYIHMYEYAPIMNRTINWQRDQREKNWQTRWQTDQSTKLTPMTYVDKCFQMCKCQLEMSSETNRIRIIKKYFM